MSRTSRWTRAMSFVMATVAFAACGQSLAGPEMEEVDQLKPTFLIGDSPLADPRPSPVIGEGGLVFNGEKIVTKP